MLILKNNLSELRTEMGLTQKQLAEMIGSSQTTVSMVELGKHCPSTYLSLLIATAFNCHIDDIFYFEDD